MRWASFLIAAAVLLFFAPLAGGRVLFYDDIYDYFHLRHLLRVMGEHGRLLFWDPFQFSGMPALADIQKGMLYPLSLPFYAMDTAYAHTVYTVVHFILLGLGTLALGRVLGLSPAGALTSALAFTFSGFVVFHLTMTPLLGSVAWLPLVLACAWRVLWGGGRHWAAGLGAAWAMQWLAGSPQIAYYAALAIAGMAAITLATRKLPLRALAWLVVGLALGIAIAAAQIAAALEIAPETPRSQGMSYDFASTYNVTGRMLWTLLSPYAFGNPPARPGERRCLDIGGPSYTGDWSLAEMCAYPGLVVWLLAAIGMASGRRLRWGLLGAAVLALWLSLGAPALLHRLLYGVVPGFNGFRAPARCMLFLDLAVALLGGLGADVLWRRPRWRPGVGVLLSVLYLDLLVAGWGYVKTSPWAATLPDIPAAQRIAQTPGLFRIVSGTSPALPGTGVARTAALNLQNVQGINPIALTRYIQALYFNEAGRFPRSRQEFEVELSIRNHLFIVAHPTTPLLALLNARFILEPGAPDRGLAGARALENPHALPRYWLAHRAEVEPDGERALGRVQRGEVDPRRVILLADAAPALADAAGAAEKVEVIAYDLDRIALRVDCAAPALLGCSEVYERGWRADVDGVAAQPLRAFHTLLAIPVPAGTHTVTLRYRPRSLPYGLALSALGLVALLGLLAWPTRYRIS